MATINQNHEFDSPGTSVVEHTLQSGSSRAARVQDIVDQKHILIRHIKIEMRPLDNRLSSDQGEVISIKSNVQNSKRKFLAR